MKNLHKIALILLLFSYNSGYAQFKNEVTYFYLRAYYFDKYPFKLNSLQDFLLHRISYTRYFGKKKIKGITIDLGHNHNRYYSEKTNFFEFPENSYLERESIYLGAGYNQILTQSKYFQAKGIVGLKYRYKSYNKLLVAIYQNSGEAIIQYLNYDNSLGLSLGIATSAIIYNKWKLVLDATYVRYFNSSPVISRFGGQKINDPQRNTLITGLGLSYCFSK